MADRTTMTSLAMAIRFSTRCSGSVGTLVAFAAADPQFHAPVRVAGLLERDRLTLDGFAFQIHFYARREAHQELVAVGGAARSGSAAYATAGFNVAAFATTTPTTAGFGAAAVAACDACLRLGGLACCFHRIDGWGGFDGVSGCVVGVVLVALGCLLESVLAVVAGATALLVGYVGPFH